MPQNQPLDAQSLAITGSVNQYGRVQPIGGVNKKIEDFFDICKARGLSGEPDAQGMVPEGSINYLVATQLAEMSALRQAFAASGKKQGGMKSGNRAQTD